jgi:hypothetical protein
MTTQNLRQLGLTLLAASALAAAAPNLAQACACGCGVFDVGDGTMMPNDSNSGFSAWFRYAYMDQNQNWEGASKALAADNGDKEIKTSFYTVGGQYVINRSWTVMAELPVYDRGFTTTDDGTIQGPNGSIYTAHLAALGDMQIMGMYTGFSPDMSTGVTLGVKLPTGDYTGPNGALGGPLFDRDSLPGTGSTDIIIGGYHAGALSKDNRLNYFVQVRYQEALVIRGGYRPGNEFDSAVGVSYNLGVVGPFAKLAPTIQLINSQRNHDSGINSDYLNSGYERLLIAPGVSARLNRHLRVYADVAIPVYQHTNAASSVSIEGTSGQLVAPQLFKIQFGYDF